MLRTAEIVDFSRALSSVDLDLRVMHINVGRSTEYHYYPEYSNSSLMQWVYVFFTQFSFPLSSYISRRKQEQGSAKRLQNHAGHFLFPLRHYSGVDDSWKVRHPNTHALITLNSAAYTDEFPQSARPFKKTTLFVHWGLDDRCSTRHGLNQVPLPPLSGWLPEGANEESPCHVYSYSKCKPTGIVPWGTKQRIFL